MLSTKITVVELDVQHKKNGVEKAEASIVVPLRNAFNGIYLRIYVADR